MTEAPARVLTIPAAAPFLEVFAAALLDGRLVAGPPLADDPLALADAIIYVPTRRAGRALAEALVAANGGRPLLLPKIRPLGAVDEDLAVLDGGDAAAAALPPAADPLERRLAMTELVLGWTRALTPAARARLEDEPVAVPASAADAARLADDLLALMDQVATEEASWGRLAEIVPAELASWWQISLAFLSIATESWPAILAAGGRIDPIARRLALIDAEARRLAAAPPAAPVIVAGSTGSVPATARLMQAIARSPRGAVVLPGLDAELDAATWALLGAEAGEGAVSHPQYGLARLLDRIGVGRDDVVALADIDDAGLAARARLVSEAFRPVGTTDLWQAAAARVGGGAAVDAALAGVAVVEAGNEREEALAVALALREAVEEGARRVALVTPDRGLARRTAAELARWGVRADDSAGVPLGDTPPGILLRLVAAVALDGAAAAAVIALLEHPAARFGLDAATVRRGAEAIDLAVLRGPRLAPGLPALTAAAEATLAAAFADRPRPESEDGSSFASADGPPPWQGRDGRARADGGLADGVLLARRLAAALAPLADLADREAVSVAVLAAATRAAVAATVTAADEPPAAHPAAALVDEGLMRLAGEAGAGLMVAPGEWPGLVQTLIGDAPVRPERGGDERILILGPLEARLQPLDLVVLAGLNERAWPRPPTDDPWLSRQMRAALGLEAPERRIGLSAHDVTQALGVGRVVLSRSARAGGAPTVASRWLQRLAAVAEPRAWAAARSRGGRLLDLARGLDRPDGPPRPAPRPEPRPRLDARPAKLSVTEIETLIRDPYAVYARRVLALKELDPHAADPGAAERGTMIHAALARFLATYAGPFDEAAVAALLTCGRAAFAPVAGRPEVMALWWPRFERTAAAFVARMAGEPQPRRRHLEVGGGLAVPLVARGVVLTGRADRIDETAEGLVVVDYKTGKPPSVRQVASMLAPQLPLEAAMAMRGGFSGVPAGLTVAALVYVALRGRAAPVEVEEMRGLVKGDPARGVPDRTPADMAEEAWSRLVGLVAAFEDPSRPYLSRARPQFERAFAGPYDHLARVKEWRIAEEEG